MLMYIALFLISIVYFWVGLSTLMIFLTRAISYAYNTLKIIKSVVVLLTFVRET